ncbi:Asp-tRNA(Asn)/Glu-tRNA(Gln) amidotransferase subunit GatA [Treponema phagedenis]|uniref:Glutamyl-tRNA(Gln) amidotransferase subunit A n=1 Tax=Treponema phagedenis TaxID=162 RepID=A0A0B7GXQ5_TREPH|nr:Asp-tRNA(Asn)/Glu-tRNA(Gln) amidotransferase subunit GatA [Treponema phagedenis]EFW37785.1 aspartyl/glutamyl-tRNA(Asn/Gln) amidotransferase, A subunit [Treponema phagedenis F0421]QEJ95955.1 Asp-tRNA(Asn)/Glu-tRNA(Gln) amidotransferase subunit GatA [Treponema phagedenis]QEJ97301.1 Asp-tRNA(Asn)/Glu-tRNA(Gln) amidotransferase subunit GatA [Treponema phagedenis]QEK00346.1 Asp-tRNA(Asn)/Glu-tRNA(Gln) amidotransferase subunit GatA [Treponema phagedenis]QEK02505.1 Asp-tRNA(Asn)/Glu-tRNA(Gln) amid
MDICNLNFSELKQKLDSRELSSLEIVQAFKKAYEDDAKNDLPLNGFIEFFSDAEEKAKKADEERGSGGAADKPLLGLPFAVKDNISIKGEACTCCSKILQGYTAPFNATVIERLLAAGAIPIGRTNMDEFAMGSSTEYSIYGPSRNPIDRSRTTGGSSGGSAAVVAGSQAPLSLGTETGGSVRLPASYCGLYGLKPTYGTLSRYGVVAFGSSLDQVGLFAKSADDIALALSVMVGKDARDETSADIDFAGLSSIQPFSKEELKNIKVALPKEFIHQKALAADVSKAMVDFFDWLRMSGVQTQEIDLPVLDAAVPVYYVIAVSEAASNLMRFDGIRYGLREDPGKGYDELYIATRSDGFGPEVKRRIITGNYVLSHHFSGDCYEKSLHVRARIERETSETLRHYDFICSPTAPTPAFKLGEKINDPVTMYLSDLFTTFVNLARVPSVSVPSGMTENGLPIGMQIVGKHFDEKNILRLAKTWEIEHK